MIKNNTAAYITVTNRGEIMRIPIDDILYVSQRERRILIKAEEGEIFTYGKLSDIADCFDSRFKKILKFTIINFERVKLFSKQTVYFDNGEAFMLGRTNYTKAKTEYTEYIKKMSINPPVSKKNLACHGLL